MQPSGVCIGMSIYQFSSRFVALETLGSDAVVFSGAVTTRVKLYSLNQNKESNAFKIKYVEKNQAKLISKI